MVSCGSDPAAKPAPPPATGGAPSQHHVPTVLNGTEIASGHIDIKGTTTDDYVVGLDQERGAIVVPPTGGDPTVVDAAADAVSVRANVLFAFHNFDFIASMGDLMIWTAANGVVPFSADATSMVAASDDGTRILATQASSSDGTQTDLVLGGTDAADAGAPMVLRTVSRKRGCAPFVEFVESVFVILYCALDSDSPTLATVDPTSGTVTDLATGVDSVSAVPSNGTTPARLLTLDFSSGNLAIMPLSGGSATALASGVTGYAPLADHTSVLVRSDTDVRRVPIDGTAPTLLVSGAVATLRGSSPDGQYFLYSSELGAQYGGNLFLASAVNPSSPTTLDEALDGTVFGSGFTADSSRAVYVTKVNDLFVGTLNSQSVGGGVVTVHGTNVWSKFAYAGTRILFNDDYVPVPKRPGQATLRTVDTASSDAPAIVATHAGVVFGVNQAKDHVFFSFDDGTDKAGVYSAPLP